MVDNFNESGEASLQGCIYLMDPFRPLVFIERDPEAGHHADEKDSRPQLQSPIDGTGQQAIST